MAIETINAQLYQPRIGNQLRMLSDTRTPREIIQEAQGLRIN